MIVEQTQPNWKGINTICKRHLHLQKTRVGFDLSAQKIIEQAQIDAGLLIETYKEVVEGEDPKTGKINPDLEGVERLLDDSQDKKILEEGTRKAVARIVKPKDDTQETVDALAKIHQEVVQTREYLLMYNTMRELHRLEKDLVKKSLELYDSSRLWDWCLNTKGLGEIAGLTFSGFINPFRKVRSKVDGMLHYVTLDDVYSFFGLIPDAGRKHGVQSRNNPKIKGRFLGVVTPGIIKAQDPYYYPLFRMKKDYYLNRPDFLALQEKKKKGFNAIVNRYAMRWLCKILISHAFDMMIPEEDSRAFAWDRHRNPIPPKPRDPTKIEDIHKSFLDFTSAWSEKTKEVWLEGDFEKYKFFLKNNDFRFKK